MDWQKYCVIDNKTHRDITDRIKNMHKSMIKSRYYVCFYIKEKEYEYSLDRLTCLKDPQVVDLADRYVFVNGILQTDIVLILKFQDWYKIQYTSGAVETVHEKKLQLIKDRKKEPSVCNIIGYLTDIAANENDSLYQDEDEPNFLEKQLSSIPILENTVLSALISDKEIKAIQDDGPIIAPFSSNESQLKATHNALHHNISEIQGPPGTGKTQTILNIISNLLIRGKTIAVVSGNNEATRNVYEKLQKEGLGEICAFLGNKENIKEFFSQDHSKTQMLEYAESFRHRIDAHELRLLERAVLEIYRDINEKAKLKAEIDELRIEKEINDESYSKDTLKRPSKLKKKMSAKCCLELAALLEAATIKAPSLLTRLKLFLFYKIDLKKELDISMIIDYLQNRYYVEKLKENEETLRKIERRYSDNKNKETLEKFQKASKAYLMSSLLQKYSSFKEKKYYASSYRKHQSFVAHYPIVLSTTHSLNSCSPEGVLYDYVIIDESSQVNLTSAAIALSRAKRAIIVGDSKQLPHIVPENLKGPLEMIKEKYSVPSFFDYTRNSLLESIQIKYDSQLPITLLNEHYRCDPEIIGFCNKRFYDGNLVIETEHHDKGGITIIETPSHTAEGRCNRRQAEIIRSEILPTEKENEVGIVAPYRKQVALIKDYIRDESILVDTVHKFQGKERDTMILSTTADRTVISDDPEHIDFLNNPNLINVAISRAKKHLYVIASSEALSQEGTLLCDLAKYVSCYCQNSNKIKTKVYSVFDLMYDEYSPILQDMKNRILKVSDFQSENIIATIIDEICRSKKYGLLSFKHNYPLRKIVNPKDYENPEERNFILSPGSHCDFILFDKLNKRIRLCIEVDGKQHEEKIQKGRDEKKDSILHQADLKVIRIKTTDLNVKERIEEALK